MDLELPSFVLSERDAVLREIEGAFDGVSRQDGVSWSESAVIDDYGSPQELARARASDPQKRWQDLVDDPDWDTAPGIGGWSFLDAIGFRYYLPAAMVRSVRQGWNAGILFSLELPEDEGRREWYLVMWSALDQRQRLCIKRFLEYMHVANVLYMEIEYPHDWSSALRAYWGQVEETEIQSTKTTKAPSSHRSKRSRRQEW